MAHPMRRTDRRIDDPAHIDRLLTQARYVTIALVDDGEPYIVTLSYGYDAPRRRLCFHVAKSGRKLDVIARDPRACATVIADLGYKKGECAHPFESVVMTGVMRPIDDPAEIRDAMRVLIGQLESAEDAQAVFGRNKLETDAALARFSLLVLEIESMSAKKGE